MPFFEPFVLVGDRWHGSSAIALRRDQILYAVRQDAIMGVGCEWQPCRKLSL